MITTKMAMNYIFFIVSCSKMHLSLWPICYRSMLSLHGRMRGPCVICNGSRGIGTSSNFHGGGAHSGGSLVSVFQEFSAGIDKTLPGELGAGLLFYGV